MRWPREWRNRSKALTVESDRITTRARLPKEFRPLHVLRHVSASMLPSSCQVDLYTLQKLLTHKSPQMTQRYAHLRDDALRRTSDVAGDVLPGSAKNGPGARWRT
ncbi:tyrosine-type recombinase/integrase [Desulfolutivibrio sulfoxidireducens]|nr:tyrosine-type recombinase/integrase [Desulfolutivibrio sulfoxidireducens]